MSTESRRRAVAESERPTEQKAKTPGFAVPNDSTHLEENLENTMIVQFVATLAWLTGALCCCRGQGEVICSYFLRHLPP